MPGTTPPTSQLEWLSSTTAMIVLFWSRATRDLLRSFGWGIAALHRENAATKLPRLAARPIASIGSAKTPPTVRGHAGRLFWPDPSATKANVFYVGDQRFEPAGLSADVSDTASESDQSRFPQP